MQPLALALLLATAVAPSSAPQEPGFPRTPVAAEPSAPRAELPDWYPAGPRPPFVGARAAELGDAPEVIHLGNARFSAHEELALPPALALADESGFRPGYFLVHFAHAPTRADKALLDALTGPVRGRDGERKARWYVPNRTLVAWVAGPEVLAELASAAGVSALRRYEPAFKLSPSIGRLVLTSPERLQDPWLRLTLDLVPGADVSAVAAALGALGAEVVDEIFVGGERGYDAHFLVVRAPPERLVALAHVEGVRYVQEAEDGLALHDLSASGKIQNRSLGEDEGGSSPIVTAGDFPLWVTHALQGQGQLIGIVDTHLDWNNGPPVPGFPCDGVGFRSDAIDNFGFADPVSPLLSVAGNGVSLKVPRVDQFDGARIESELPPRDDAAHGTHVAAAAAADFHGADDATWWEADLDANDWDGVPGNQHGLLGPGGAPEAQIYFAPVLDEDNEFAWAFDFHDNLGDSLRNFANAGAAASAHSTGIQEANDEYTALSVVHDVRAHDRPLMLQVVAAGNNSSFANPGPLTSQGVVKNALSVGASDDVLLPENRAPFSSVGPRFDGALKPDILAPGDDGTAGLAMPHSNGSLSEDPCTVFETAGTSFAAPLAAGAAALVHQYFEEGHYAGAVPITDPSAALLKAMLVNSAQRLTGSNLGPGELYPSGYQGWGEPRLTGVLELPGTERDLVAWDAPGAGPTPFADAGDVPWFFRIAVTDDDEDLRVTLCWTDEPGSTGTGKQLKNDLDLALRPPGADAFQFLGNVFDTDDGESIPGGSRDTLNNLESAHLEEPDLGTWIARVSAPEGSFDDPQGFALVATGLLGSESFFRPATVSLVKTPGFEKPDTQAAAKDGTIPRTVVAAFRLSATGEDVDAGALALTLSDPALDAFGPIQLWVDTDGDALLDPLGSPLGTATVNGTVATFAAGLLPDLADGVPVSLLVTVGIPPLAIPATSGSGAAGAGATGAAGAAGALLLGALALAGSRAGAPRRALRPALGAGIALLVALALVVPSCGGGGGPPSFSVELEPAGFDLDGEDSLEPVAPEEGVSFSFAVEPFEA